MWVGWWGFFVAFWEDRNLLKIHFIAAADSEAVIIQQ